MLKIEQNIQQDIEITERLKAEGWIVLRSWRSDIEKNLIVCADKTKKAIKECLNLNLKISKCQTDK